MNRSPTTTIAAVFAVVLSIALATLAMINTEILAQFFTHSFLADHAGVDIRPVTRQGAEWFRIMCALSAFAWLSIPLMLLRIEAKTGHDPRSHVDAALDFVKRSALTNRLRFALFCALSVGLIERIWRISESLWFDEISAMIDYAQYGPGPILGSYFVPSNHVLHTLLSWCAISMANGASEPVLRMPAFIAGIASIGAITALARESALWQGVPTRARMSIACGIAALAPIMVLESVEARGYSMMILFSALASWQFLRSLRTGRLLGWIAYAILCALGVWSHLVFVVLPVSHGLIAAWLAIRPRQGSDDRANGKSALLALALAAITSITLLAPLLPDLLLIRREFQALDGNEPSIFSTEGIHVLLGLGGAWTALAALPGIGLLIIGVLAARRDLTRRMPLAATLLGLPILVLGTEFAGSWMYARFALFALPGIFLAMTLGAFDVARFLRAHDSNMGRVNSTLILGVLAVAALWTESLASLPSKQPIRDAVFFIQGQDPTVATFASAGLADNVVAYYGILAGLKIESAGAGGSAIGEIPSDVEWMVVIYPRSLCAAGARALTEHWHLVETFPGWVDWNNGDVLVYRRNTAANHSKE